MNIIDLIIKKRNGLNLDEAEIYYLISEYAKDRIPDYQMAAFLMASYFRGLSLEESSFLTKAMIDSGEQIDLSSIDGIKVDKHSTGGVGDTITLALAPLVAAAGAPVAKMSGRGLGHTGGTIDKLESIPGMKINLDIDDFINQVKRINIAIIGQTPHLTPADGKIYALRDVTGTVDQIGLIASSVMSKKIAAGAECIVLDVKAGTGAFMQSIDEAFMLADWMVKLGQRARRKTFAFVTNMDQPLGLAIGNALEVKEAIDVLKGNYCSEELKELTLLLGAQMLVFAEKAKDTSQARSILLDLIGNGKAIAKFKEFIIAQGGNPDVIDDPGLLPEAPVKLELLSKDEGYISSLYAEIIGKCALQLGAGRLKKGDPVDHGVGIKIQRKVGDKVKKGEALATIYANSLQNANDTSILLQKAYTFSNQQIDKPKLIYGTLESK